MRRREAQAIKGKEQRIETSRLNGQILLLVDFSEDHDHPPKYDGDDQPVKYLNTFREEGGGHWDAKTSKKKQQLLT